MILNSNKSVECLLWNKLASTRATPMLSMTLTKFLLVPQAFREILTQTTRHLLPRESQSHENTYAFPPVTSKHGQSGRTKKYTFSISRYFWKEQDMYYRQDILYLRNSHISTAVLNRQTKHIAEIGLFYMV